MSYESDRFYSIGEYEYPSVTSVIAATTPKPWLGAWQRKMVAEYMVTKIEDFEEVPERVILSAIAKEAIAYPDTIKDEAGERGLRLHGCIDAFAKGETVTLTPDIEQPFNKFMDWYNGHNIGVLFTEAQVWDDKHGYAGRVDWIHQLRKPHQRKNRIYITDFKISPRIYQDHKLQVAAYAYATQKTLNIYVDGAMIVALGHEKSPKYKELTKAELRHLYRIFLAKLHTYYLENRWEGKRK